MSSKELTGKYIDKHEVSDSGCQQRTMLVSGSRTYLGHGFSNITIFNVIAGTLQKIAIKSDKNC